MKISLLVESGKSAEESSMEITNLLHSAGYKVMITWPSFDVPDKRDEQDTVK